MNSKTFRYGIDRLTVGIAVDIANQKTRGILDQQARAQISKSRKIVDKTIQKGEVVYGITTGFGALCSTLIDPDLAGKLQHNLLKSHAVGVGEYIPQKIAKLMLILKAHALAQGFSGITLTTLERIIWHIDQDIIPCVPTQGSVGASGDLAPLAHLFLPLIGMGRVEMNGRIEDAGEVLSNLELKSLALEAKEGLALINGTQFMAAYGVQSLFQFQNCLDHADIIASIMVEAIQGSIRPFDKGLHDLRPFDGCIYVAERMRTFLADSEIMQSHEDCDRIQDPYSLRCIPQVHGASRNAYVHVRQLIETEINSVTDNPILLDEDRIISGGNFHGQPIALALDYLAVAAAEIGNISDRRIYLAFEGKYEGLPKLLMKETGLNSGFMMVQYTTAALVSENKALSYPASVDSIPTSLGQEDHVSMGAISGRKTYKIVKNLEKILALELLCAAQGLDFRKPLKSSKWIEKFHALVRTKIAHRVEDALFEKEIREAINIVRNRDLIHLADQEKGNQDKFKNSRHEVFGIY